ncbi:hypothetical protein [Streptomyces sp. NPDC003688]
MREVAAVEVLCVFDWNPAVPDQLTTLAVSGETVDAAERAAASTLPEAGTTGPASWLDLPVPLRRQLVRAYRSVPTLGLYCVIDDERPGVTPREFLRAAVADTAEQFAPLRRARTAHGFLVNDPFEELRDALRAAPYWDRDARPRFLPRSSFPGLCELVRLTAVFCRETLYRTDIPEDEDLLGIYDTYVVGGL